MAVLGADYAKVFFLGVRLWREYSFRVNLAVFFSFPTVRVEAEGEQEEQEHKSPTAAKRGFFRPGRLGAAADTFFPVSVCILPRSSDRG